MRFSQYMTITGSTGIPYDVDVDYDKKLFKRMVDFIVSLDPNILSEEQKAKIVDIIKDFKLNVGDDKKLDQYYSSNKETFDKTFYGNMSKL